MGTPRVPTLRDSVVLKKPRKSAAASATPSPLGLKTSYMAEKVFHSYSNNLFFRNWREQS